ncbi:hypothetical protein [Candidatus Tisiphia endosymbiont of Dioctria rufipes]|uniref:hypothetical protein n=1 Tax=Candidatus Tisiphia endosymbiont of Dioctria rufipes TaxID=3066255 RepID=UPI00312C8C60
MADYNRDNIGGGAINTAYDLYNVSNVCSVTLIVLNTISIMQNDNDIGIELSDTINFTQNGHHYKFQTQDIADSTKNLVLENGSTITLILAPGKKISFTKDDISYLFENSDLERFFIKDIISFTNTCQLLNTIVTNPEETIAIDLGKAAPYLRTYENMDKKLISLFAEQNNMIFDPKKVELFIKKYFFELAGIARQLTVDFSSKSTTTNLTSLPKEMLDEICYHLRISDVKMIGEHDGHHPALLGDGGHPTE